MQLAATVVAFGAAPIVDAAQLDTTALSCEVLAAEFPKLKRTRAGSLVLLLCERTDDPALAAATKAADILHRPTVLALPRSQRDPERLAALTQACVVQLTPPLSWADAVRCFVEPLAVFGLAGVEPGEIRALVRPRAGVLHTEILPNATDALVTCRLRPNASLRDLDDAARDAAERAPKARIVVAGPEVGNAGGPRVLVASLF